MLIPPPGFDEAAAADARRAIDRCIYTLSALRHERRSSGEHALERWEGRFADDFRSILDRGSGVLIALEDRLRTMAGAVVDAQVTFSLMERRYEAELQRLEEHARQEAATLVLVARGRPAAHPAADTVSRGGSIPAQEPR